MTDKTNAEAVDLGAFDLAAMWMAFNGDTDKHLQTVAFVEDGSMGGAMQRLLSSLWPTVDTLTARLAEAESKLDPNHPSCLEGYRELGARCAKLEAERDDAIQRLPDMEANHIPLGDLEAMTQERDGALASLGLSRAFANRMVSKRAALDNELTRAKGMMGGMRSDVVHAGFIGADLLKKVDAFLKPTPPEGGEQDTHMEGAPSALESPAGPKPAEAESHLVRGEVGESPAPSTPQPEQRWEPVKDADGICRKCNGTGRIDGESEAGEGEEYECDECTGTGAHKFRVVEPEQPASRERKWASLDPFDWAEQACVEYESSCDPLDDRDEMRHVLQKMFTEYGAAAVAYSRAP